MMAYALIPQVRPMRKAVRGELSSMAISSGIRATQARKEMDGFGKERAIRVPLAIASHPRRSNSSLILEVEIRSLTHAPDFLRERCLTCESRLFSPVSDRHQGFSGRVRRLRSHLRSREFFRSGGRRVLRQSRS